MNEVRTLTFSPSVGMRIELPSDVRRINMDRLGSPQYGYGDLQFCVIGVGATFEYVVLRADEEPAELEEDTQVLGVDGATGDLWYASPTTNYGGAA